MNQYEQSAFEALNSWVEEQESSPSLAGRATKVLQKGINHMVPETVHKVITKAIKQMVKGVLSGSEYTTRKPRKVSQNLQEIEEKIEKKIKIYRSTAAAEGAVTGAGGFFLGLADFPLWLSLKMKMLFEIAAIHGIDTTDYRERLYLLNIFRLAFSNQHRKNLVIKQVLNWELEKKQLPENLNSYDWRSFQLEYRDNIDLAKLLQLIPGVGAVVGLYVNHRYTDKLGRSAINCYRIRYFQGKNIAKKSSKWVSFFERFQGSH